MKRRDFLKSFAVGIVGPFFVNIFSLKKHYREYLTPYVEPVDNVVPGIPTWYSSVCRQCSAGCGIHVKITEGRAKKIEGNPDFPINKGKLCVRGQSALQVLYNPDRIKGPLIKKSKSGKFSSVSWDEALNILSEKMLDAKKRGKHQNVTLLTQPVRGVLSKLINSFMTEYGSSNIISSEFFDNATLKKANELCFGRNSIPDYDIKNTKYILSFGAEFLDTWISPVQYSVGYGVMRSQNKDDKKKRGWLVHFEPRLSLTGANADEWRPIIPETEGLLALSIAHVIANNGLADPSIRTELPAWEDALKEYSPEKISKKTGIEAKTITKIAKEFASNQPGLAICGNNAASQTNGTFNVVATNILNHLVGNIGKEGGVRWAAPIPHFSEFIEKSAPYGALADLSKAMSNGQVEILLINEINPVFSLPEKTKFADSLKKVPFVVSFSPFMDETAKMADLILPGSTFLESWGDYIPITDSGHQAVGIMQPVVNPVFDTRSLGDIILALAKSMGENISQTLSWATFFDFFKSSWQTFYNANRQAVKEKTFDTFWDNLISQGGYWQEKESFTSPQATPSPEILSKVTYKKDGAQQIPRQAGNDTAARGLFHLHIYPSSKLYDGRGANQPWLQQLPEPLVTATWGSWIEINPEKAKELSITEGDIIKIKTTEGSIEVPAYLYPAIEPNTVAIPIGQGHTDYGRYAQNTGENPLKFLKPVKNGLSGAMIWASTKVSLSKTGKRERVLKTEPDLVQPGMKKGLRELNRHIVQWIDPKELEGLADKKLEAIKALPSRDLQKPPHFLSGIGLGKYRASMFHDYKYRWGMVIDLDKCTGCSACMVACYAENNLPLVSPKEIARKRHKNWIRVDRYWEGEYPDIKAKQIPANCYQCGNAPCEPVCPVYAAYHTQDGLNGQVYQRCIGTRYCNVNCPYKARLFNWFTPKWPKPLDRQLNPDLSVRTSGITDKCTFCVQRIRLAKDKAKDEGRDVKDGEIQPACMQTCPSNAIIFGNLMDEASEVSKLTKNPRRYRVLEELNTEPAVVYLKAVRKGVEPGKHG